MRVKAANAIGRVDAQTEAAVGFRGTTESTDRQDVLGLMPGAFNPFHRGHQQMLETAAAALGHNVDCEISLRNVEKKKLTAVELAARLGQFSASQRIWVTQAATFVEKAALFPGATFVVGVDTILRVADPAYYEDRIADRDRALAAVAEQGCKYLVFGRLIDDVFRSLDDLELPRELGSLCRGVAEAAFRVDLSASEVRLWGEAAASVDRSAVPEQEQEQKREQR